MLAALVGMVLIPVTQSKFAEVVIPVIYGVVSIVLVAFVYKNGSQLINIMSNKYLNIIAKRSFAFYLWHYPAVIITKNFMGNVRMPYVFMFVIQLIIAVVMAVAKLLLSSFSYAVAALEGPVYASTPAVMTASSIVPILANATLFTLNLLRFNFTTLVCFTFLNNT